LPVTPEKLALVRQYLTEANALAALKALSALSYSQAEAQMTAATKRFTKPQQSMFMEAFAGSFNAAESKLEARIADEMETYYAARLTEDELRTVADFFGSGVGYKMLHDGQNLTPEDRQQAGSYMFNHPALLKFTKLNFDYMKGMQARRQASQAIFTADFTERFCQALAKDHLKMSTCSAPGLHQTPR